jgi:hypothetical protein
MIGSCVAVAVCVAQAPLPTTVRAAALEAQGQWDAALALYLQLHATGPASPAIPDRIRHCLRRSAQQSRVRDRGFQSWAAGLTLADALQLYQSVLDQLSRRHPDGTRATPRLLFSQGAIEFDRALGDPAFRDATFHQADVTAVRGELQAIVRPETVTTIAEARGELRDFVLRVRLHAPRADGVAIVMQFLFGACAGLDEWTTLQWPGEPTTSAASVGGAAMLEPGIGYLRIAEFTTTTAGEFDAAVAMLVGQGMTSLVVDLRGNPGGLLAAGIDVARRLLPAGEIVRTDGRDPAFAGRVVTSHSGMAALPVPLTILVDGGTISTAEVLATAVQANQRGRLVGMPTHGKGTVQTSVEVKSGRKSLLILTVANLVDGAGMPTAGRKVEPDIREPDPDLQLKAAIADAKAMASTRMP